MPGWGIIGRPGIIIGGAPGGPLRIIMGPGAPGVPGIIVGLGIPITCWGIIGRPGMKPGLGGIIIMGMIVAGPGSRCTCVAIPIPGIKG